MCFWAEMVRQYRLFSNFGRFSAVGPYAPLRSEVLKAEAVVLTLVGCTWSNHKVSVPSLAYSGRGRTDVVARAW